MFKSVYHSRPYPVGHTAACSGYAIVGFWMSKYHIRLDDFPTILPASYWTRSSHVTVASVERLWAPSADLIAHPRALRSIPTLCGEAIPS